MELIDFEEKFKQYYEKFLDAHPEIAHDEKKIAQVTGELYLKWLDMPHQFLGGKTADEYYNAMDTPTLLALLLSYIEQEISIPSGLMSALAGKPETLAALKTLIERENVAGISSHKLPEAKSVMATLISEIGGEHNYAYYMDYLTSEGCHDPFSEEIQHIFTRNAKEVRDMVYQGAINTSDKELKEVFLDILCEVRDDDDIFDLLMNELMLGECDLSFLAFCIGKYQDFRAIEPLKEVLKEPGIDFFEYTAVRNALEELGAEIEEEREFDGDDIFELMKDGNFDIKD